MSERELTRRELLRARWRRTDAPTSERTDSSTQVGRLPSVISWLDPGMQATPRRSLGGARGLQLRPPGAIEEREFLAACTGCGDCVAACAPRAIALDGPAGARGEPTPRIDPYSAPCRLCSDLPCISACGSGALRAEAPAALGLAHVLPMECLNRLGSPCTVCAERCPIEGALRMAGDLPQVDAGLCTGCGICAHVCPAPGRAIAILPNRARPTRDALERRGAAT